MRNLGYGVGYNEVQDGDLVDCVISSEPYNVTVAEATPALSATGGPTTLTAGDDYTLFPSYTDTVGDHVVSDFSVDWGDGTTNVYEEYIPAEATHTYESAGEYEPSLHVTAFDDDGHIDGSSDLVDVTDPTVGITAGDNPTAYEDGQVPYDFAVTRSNEGDQPMTVGLNIDGSLPSSAYVATDSDGRILDGSVTIPAGSNEADVIVYPLEDQTPRWTETVDITLTGGSSDYAIDDDNSAAGCYVVNDDLYAWLDNGSDNEILDGSSNGETSLVPLVLDLPSEERDGAEIVLTDNAASEADVYITSDPGPGDQPILGDVNGTYVSSVTWTVGVSGGAPLGETTFHVGGTNGSASLNDISFQVQDDDSGTDSDAAASKPELAQGDADQPDTDVLAPTNAAAVKTVQIQYLSQYVTGANAGTVIVGQGVFLKAVFTGPGGAFPQNATFQWSIPGTIVGDYSESADAGFTTPARLNQSSVLFFWLDGGNAQQGVNRTITLTAAGFTEQTTFTVVNPTAEIQTQTGQVVVKNNLGGIATTGDVEFQGTDYGGIYFKMLNPAIPANFTGSWDWTQVESLTYSLTDNNNTVHNEVDNFWTLDNGKIPSNLPQPAKAYHYNVEGSNDAADEPLLGGDSAKYKAFSADFTADMYLMFQPNTALSIEVPIRVVPWYWGGSAVWDPTVKNPDNTNGAWVERSAYWSANPSDQETHSPPTWSRSNHHPYTPPL